MRLLSPFLVAFFLLAAKPSWARDDRVTSPDKQIVCAIKSGEGLRYSVEFGGRPAIENSRLGLFIKDGISLGPSAIVDEVSRTSVDSTWENPLGQRRFEGDHYNEVRLQMHESSAGAYRFNLIVRVYDDGVAFRYEVPKQTNLDSFVVLSESTEFIFHSDYRCWAGDYSNCAEVQYPEKHLTDLSEDLTKPHVLPLLVELPQGYAAVAESDVIDWAGMFVSSASLNPDGTRRPGARATLAARKDGNGLVMVKDRRLSPWRVIMLAPTAAALLASDLIPTLATPAQFSDLSWIKPGITSWDAWWTGVNVSRPPEAGGRVKGDTRSDKEYIDLSAEMGWPYQLIDWGWYDAANSPEADLTKPNTYVDIPGLVDYAKQRGVQLILWIDSRDLTRQGVDKIFTQVQKWGIAGVKVDFMNSDSQETVRWYWDTIASAASHRLLIDFHGASKPTGLARTWPNYITQEGVLGNEYNKIVGARCSPLHTLTLPFTRGLLGPMDFTPGGFLNRTPAEFKMATPAEVIGTRARQLAMTVVYKSPLLCLCDSPANYRGQPGLEFFRGLPTVWDETVVISAKVSEHVVIARRSKEKWYIGAMNGDAPLTLSVPLAFLGPGKWKLTAFCDTPQSAAHPEMINKSAQIVSAADVVPISLSPAGGYAASLELH